MKKYLISYETAYGIDHAIVYANTKNEARKNFNLNIPIAGARIHDIEELKN